MEPVRDRQRLLRRAVEMGSIRSQRRFPPRVTCESRDSISSGIAYVTLTSRQRTMAVGKEQMLLLDKPPVVGLVRLIHSRDGEVVQVSEGLREPVRALPLVVFGLYEASNNRGVSLGSTFLEEAYFVTPAKEVSLGLVKSAMDHLHNPCPGPPGVVNGSVSPEFLRGVIRSQARADQPSACTPVVRTNMTSDLHDIVVTAYW